MWQQLLKDLKTGDVKALARSISFVENEQPGFEEMLTSLPETKTSTIIGITGPPGAGKSTVTDALIGEGIKEGKKVAVLCVDPSSPFNLGAVLGDRIRMSNWYNHPGVFIRSLATRGSMGGLHPHIIEITELVKVAGYNLIIVETVGVGQSEIEIAGLADVTVVVVVPEAGDEVQTMKAGLMEIADIFVVNKSDRPDAELFVKNLKQMLAPAFSNHQEEVSVLKTVATRNEGIDLLYKTINNQQHHANSKRSWLFAEKAFHLIEKKMMQPYSKKSLQSKVEEEINSGNFNLYRFVKDQLNHLPDAG